jgi:hypothetical protein
MESGMEIKTEAWASDEQEVTNPAPEVLRNVGDLSEMARPEF